LPAISPEYASCVSFERLKDPDRLFRKMQTDDRDTFDTYGIQLWLGDVQLMKLVEKLENPQHPLRKEWQKKNIEVSIDNHCSSPPKHGYRAIHLNFSCKGNNGWDENLELQILPAPMMQTYLVTRDPYTTYRSLLEDVKARKGKNEENWSDGEKTVIHTLRGYINALYEADAHRSGLMNMVNNYHYKPLHDDEKTGRAAAEELEQDVAGLINLYNEYGEDAPSIIFGSYKETANPLKPSQ